MKNIYLTILFLLLATGFISGQSVIITSTPKTKADSDKKKTSTDELSDLIGLTNEKAPIFTATEMDGTVYDLESLRGKVVVINLWGTFCPPCIEEMPKLNALVDKFKDKNVVFLAAAVDDKELLEGFLLKFPFKYHVLPNSIRIVEQYAPKKKTNLPNEKPGGFVMLLPTHLIIDQNGIVTNHFWGYKDTAVDELSQTIEKLLQKKSVNETKIIK